IAADRPVGHGPSRLRRPRSLPPPVPRCPRVAAAAATKRITRNIRRSSSSRRPSFSGGATAFPAPAKPSGRLVSMLERRFVFRPDGLSLDGYAIVPDDPAVLVVLCHGIPGSAPRDRGDEGYAGFARELAGRGFGAFWFNFRGVRGSPGEFSIAGWMRDLEWALDAIDADAEIGGIPRVVCGSSAGGAVAIAVGARRPDVAGVATLGTPASFTYGALVDDPRKLIQIFRNTGIVHDPAFPPDLDTWWREFLDNAPEDV